MKDYNDIKYDNVRGFILDLIKKHRDKEKVLTLCIDNYDNFLLHFQHMVILQQWDIDLNDWENLVNEEWDSFVNTQPFEFNYKKGVIFSNQEVNNFELPKRKMSNWVIFKNKSLKEKNRFPEEVINNIEDDTLSIVKNLNLDTKDKEPTKGLVIGGVQSGKTTNMAALMAMAADLGFNVFIVLSGMIESLRSQTENRLRELINNTSKDRTWELVKEPKNFPNNYINNLYDPRKNLYMVVLKNSTRLVDLINWIQSNSNIASKLKVLVIDDEADQASVNTSKYPLENRKTINRLIVNLVHNKNINDENNDFHFQAINYIGYTATPYANILSESPDNYESLYPKNFIKTLTESSNHFGPKEIFGVLGENIDELDIIRNVEDIKDITDFLEYKTTNIPNSLKEAIAYFISASASLRLHNFNKPVSMLIHVSNRIEHHDLVYRNVRYWLLNNKEEVLSLAKRIWQDEKDKITINDLNNRVTYNINTILKPHSFNEIKYEIENIINTIEPIKINDNDTLYYHNGIHTIVDHSRVKSNENEEYRLNYPTDIDSLKNTPIFLVIGGATLSRGITLEGLVSTYFLRTPSSADTLTQMGRWFGYRVNYELYPRIWLTKKTNEQFKFISTLEEELRQEIISLNKLGQDFSVVSPKIIHSPQYINITSRNKSYDMINVEYDFNGYSTQTYIFDKDVSIQKHNIELTENFINGLGKPNIISNNTEKIYWENIPFKLIKDNLLNDFVFNEKIKAFKNIDLMIEWIEKATQEGNLGSWNVIIGSGRKQNDPNKVWNLKHFKSYKVKRTRQKNTFDDVINIGVLRNPNDLFGDIDESKITDTEVINILNNSKEKVYQHNVFKVRELLGLSKTPQLIIYRIDKDSSPDSNDKRDYLGIDSDIIGININIPGLISKDRQTKVSVKITKEQNDLLEDYDNDYEGD